MYMNFMDAILKIIFLVIYSFCSKEGKTYSFDYKIP